MLSFYSYQSYFNYVKPKPVDFAAYKDKTKNIVILGTGIVGLFSAYYLSNNPRNQIIILEKEGKHYEGASARIGNWLPVDYVTNWLDHPFYPYIYRALFDYENFVAKIYPRTFFESVENFLITAKFGYKWLFSQHSKSNYGDIDLMLGKWKHVLIDELIEKEGLHPWNDLGYIDGAQIVILQENPDFSPLLNGVQKFFPHNPIV